MKNRYSIEKDVRSGDLLVFRNESWMSRNFGSMDFKVSKIFVEDLRSGSLIAFLIALMLAGTVAIIPNQGSSFLTALDFASYLLVGITAVAVIGSIVLSGVHKFAGFDVFKDSPVSTGSMRNRYVSPKEIRILENIANDNMMRDDLFDLFAVSKDLDSCHVDDAIQVLIDAYQEKCDMSLESYEKKAYAKIVFTSIQQKYSADEDARMINMEVNK